MSWRNRKILDVDSPWTNTVDLDTLAGPFVAHRFGHLKDPTFGSCVGTDIDVPNKRDDACYVDDFPRPTELQKASTNFLRSYKTGFEIDCEYLNAVNTQR
jgi:hypothetical protein